MRVLDHEGLEVYQVARELSREICNIRKRIRPGHADMVDQVLRATASIPLNIAEGNGERFPGRRAYFFRVARASATELGAALDHMVDMDLLKVSDIHAAKALLVRIVSMLTRLTAKVTDPESFPPLPRVRARR